MFEYPQNGWNDFFDRQVNQPYFSELLSFLEQRRKLGAVIYPPEDDVFNCFRFTDKGNVKAVILGQDPYHQFGQAMGLCFSVPYGIAVPPSLVNIFKEIRDDVGRQPHIVGGDLTPWAEQGVLLLNTLLTVENSKPMAHKDKGWETFTDAVIREVGGSASAPCVFMLWGRPAQSKIPLIDRSRHLVLTAPHPSPLSAFSGFFGCKHFSRANSFLAQHDITPISW